MEQQLNGFDEFWAIYPRHVAKQAAARMYKRAIKSTTPDRIKRGAARYAQERAGQDPAYTKHPATWLNGGCWDDEPAAVRNGNGERDATMEAFDRLIARAEGDALAEHPAMRDITPGRSEGR